MDVLRERRQAVAQIGDLSEQRHLQQIAQDRRIDLRQFFLAETPAFDIRAGAPACCLRLALMPGFLPGAKMIDEPGVIPVDIRLAHVPDAAVQRAEQVPGVAIHQRAGQRNSARNDSAQAAVRRTDVGANVGRFVDFVCNVDFEEVLVLCGNQLGKSHPPPAAGLKLGCAANAEFGINHRTGLVHHVMKNRVLAENVFLPYRQLAACRTDVFPVQAISDPLCPRTVFGDVE